MVPSLPKITRIWRGQPIASVTILLLLLLPCAGATADDARAVDGERVTTHATSENATDQPPPHTLWLEAESFGPLKGSNFSFQPVEKTTRGAWSLAGPGVAAEWTQGGESEWMSVAARADEPGEVIIGRESEAPGAGTYTLWVRYGDYREKKESFGVRIKQAGGTFSHVFGERAVVDELDPMKLTWDWAFGWDHATVELHKGPFHIELYTTGATEARRQVDCLCLSTDSAYHPFGREKPDTPAWQLLRDLQHSKLGVLDSAKSAAIAARPLPVAWKIGPVSPTFLWNVGQPWLDELKIADKAKRIDWPFGCDASLIKEFLAAYRGKEAAILGNVLSGPAWHIPLYPEVFATGSPFTQWLSEHPDRKFAILLNYGEPTWPKDSKPDMVHANLSKLSDRFIGYVAGENISYDSVDQPALDEKIRAATSRGQILTALCDAHTAATVKKFSAYAGAPLTPEQAWADDIPCLSAGMEAFAHALANWGVKRIGHESTGNSPTLARRLAFLRGAARQFGAKVVDYQSCNLGDASTIFSRESSFFPASSRYILDNQYDAWAGSGVNWVLKDYLLFHLAGADAFYHEEGNDLFWKPGGNSAGDDFPIQLSPRGRVTEAVVRLASAHPRGSQYTPVAFLLDEAHGYSQEAFRPGAFGLDPQLNPTLLTPGVHFDSIRGWFDIAYFPAPLTQNEPATAIRQTYVDGIFGDLFDVLVTAPRHGDIVTTYPLVIAVGQINLSEEWTQTLSKYVDGGGTLVVCADQLTGPGVASLHLPGLVADAEASSFVWKAGRRSIASNVFRYRALRAQDADVLATTEDGKPICIALPRGKGRLIVIGVPLGLGIDRRPIPLLALLMKHTVDPLTPVKVHGDVEWTLNRLDDGGWLVGLLNNAGVNKPQHGVNPTDLRESRTVQITAPIAVTDSREWVTESPLNWKKQAGHPESTLTLTIPAGAVRLVYLHSGN